MDEELKEKLVELIKISSATSNIAGVEQASELFISYFKDLPIEWQAVRKEGRGTFWIGKTKLNDESPKILLSGHMDTVFPFEEVEFKIEAEEIFGSGTQDMKGGLIVIYGLLKKLHENNMLKNITFFIDPEEEILNNAYREEMKELAKIHDYAMVFESTLDSDTTEGEYSRSVVIERKGVRWQNVSIKGPGGHAGVLDTKEMRKSTILAAAELITFLESQADYSKRTTVNTGLINGGRAFNVLSDSCEIGIEFRAKTPQEIERLTTAMNSKIEEFIKQGFEIDVKLDADTYPMFVSENVKHFSKIAEEVGNDLVFKIILESRGGGSQANTLQEGNPNLAVLDGFGVRGEGQHTNKEFLYTYSLVQSVDYSFEIIKKIQSSIV